MMHRPLGPSNTKTPLGHRLVPAHWLARRSLLTSSPWCRRPQNVYALSAVWPRQNLVAAGKRSPFCDCLYTLGVHTGRCGGRCGLLFFARRLTHLLAQSSMHLVQSAVPCPAVVARVNGAPVREVMGQLPPLTTGARHIKNRIHDPPPCNLGFASRFSFDQRTDVLPLLIRQVTCISLFH